MSRGPLLISRQISNGLHYIHLAGVRFFFPADGCMWQKEVAIVPPTLRNSHSAYQLQMPKLLISDGKKES